MVPEQSDRSLDRRTVLEILAGSAGVVALGGVGGASARSESALAATSPAPGWSSYAGGDDNAGYAPDASGVHQEHLTRWTADPEPNVAEEYEQPVVLDGTVYLGGKRLHALDEATGAVEWTFATEASERDENRFHSPATDGETVYAGTGSNSEVKGKLYAVDAATGTEQWRFTPPDTSGDSSGDYGDFNYVTLADGVVLASRNTPFLEEDQVWALDAATGDRLWWTKLGVEATTPSRYVPPAAVADGKAFVKTTEALVALDVQTGETVWRFDGPNEFYTAHAAAAVSEGTVYASEEPNPADGGTSLYAVDAADGSVEWSFTPDTEGHRWFTPVVGPDRVYVFHSTGGNGDSHVYAVSRSDGSLDWKKAGYLPVTGLADGILYTGQRALDASDGTVLFEHSDNTGEPALAGDGLYLSSEKVTALSDQVDLQPRGESGSVYLGGKEDRFWHAVDLERSYDDPVVIMKPVSNEGAHPVHVRLRNVSSDSFEFMLEEWLYLNQRHTPEHVDYLVLESGHYTLDNGLEVDVGITRSDETWHTGAFDVPFDEQPVTLTQSQTFNGPHPIVTRNRHLGTESFEVRVQEEEAEGPHVYEKVGHVAVSRGDGSADASGTYATTGYEAGVDDEWTALDFPADGEYENPPLFLADMQTNYGYQPAELRYTDLTSDGVSVRVEEEQSADQETWHVEEHVGYLLLEGGRTIDGN